MTKQEENENDDRKRPQKVMDTKKNEEEGRAFNDEEE